MCNYIWAYILPLYLGQTVDKIFIFETHRGKKKCQFCAWWDERNINVTWKKYINESECIFGLEDFGRSAPYKDIYEFFSLTEDEIIKQIKKIVWHLKLGLMV